MTRARRVEFWYTAVNTALRHEAKNSLRQAAHDEVVEHAARYIAIARKICRTRSVFEMAITIDILKASR